MTAAAGDAASVTVFVSVPPLRAFEIFTAEIDAWWRRGPKFRAAGARESRLALEPGAGGRLTETVDDLAGPRTLELGRVLLWDPGRELALEWRGQNFAPDQKTLVEVRFRAQRDGTLVTVRHSGWSSLPDEHPARHGRTGADFARAMGLWWGELLSALRERVSGGMTS
jgi:uncharacterized protein YndB with AHSA1/START domain